MGISLSSPLMSTLHTSSQGHLPALENQTITIQYLPGVPAEFKKTLQVHSTQCGDSLLTFELNVNLPSMVETLELSAAPHVTQDACEAFTTFLPPCRSKWPILSRTPSH